MKKYMLVAEEELEDIRYKLDILIKNQNDKTSGDLNSRETVTIAEAKEIYGYSYQFWRNKVRKEEVLKNYGTGRNILLSRSELKQLIKPQTSARH